VKRPLGDGDSVWGALRECVAADAARAAWAYHFRGLRCAPPTAIHVAPLTRRRNTHGYSYGAANAAEQHPRLFAWRR
jgi:hypothetical protein